MGGAFPADCGLVGIDEVGGEVSRSGAEGGWNAVHMGDKSRIGDRNIRMEQEGQRSILGSERSKVDSRARSAGNNLLEKRSTGAGSFINVEIIVRAFTRESSGDRDSQGVIGRIDGKGVIAMVRIVASRAAVIGNRETATGQGSRAVNSHLESIRRCGGWCQTPRTDIAIATVRAYIKIVIDASL